MNTNEPHTIDVILLIVHTLIPFAVLFAYKLLAWHRRRHDPTYLTAGILRKAS